MKNFLGRTPSSSPRPPDGTDDNPIAALISRAHKADDAITGSCNSKQLVELPVVAQTVVTMMTQYVANARSWPFWIPDNENRLLESCCPNPIASSVTKGDKKWWSRSKSSVNTDWMGKDDAKLCNEAFKILLDILQVRVEKRDACRG
jgi:hypothetical protein